MVRLGQYLHLAAGPVALAALIGGARPAHALKIDCARWLVSWSKPERALARFDRRARTLREASEARGPRAQVRRHYHRLILAATARLLEEHDVDCPSIEASIRDHAVTLTAPRVAVQLIRRKCSEDESNVLARLTEAAFRSTADRELEVRDAVAPPPTPSPGRDHRNLRRWLGLVAGRSLLNPDAWVRLSADSAPRLLAMAAAVGDDFTRFGFDAKEITRAARALARAGLPFSVIKNRLRAPADLAESIATSLDSLQWLSGRVSARGGLKS